MSIRTPVKYVSELSVIVDGIIKLDDPTFPKVKS